MSELLSPDYMHRVIMSDSIEYPGLESITYTELFERYTSCHLGEHHAQQTPRYANKYPYEHSMMLSDLGDDIHPVEHGRYTHDEVVVPLLYAQNCSQEGDHLEPFSQQDIVAMRLAAYIHDFGECEHEDLVEAVGDVTGDVCYGTKTAADEAIETRIRNYLKDMLYADIPDELWTRVESIVAGGDDSQPARGFSLAEHIGYYLTGLRAAYLAAVEVENRRTGNNRRDDSSLAQLCLLTTDMLPKHQETTVPTKTEGFAYGTIVLANTAQLYHLTQDIVRNSELSPAIDV